MIKRLLLMMGIITILLSVIGFAEISSWNTIVIDRTNSLVKLHGTYWVEDTNVESRANTQTTIGRLLNPSALKPITIELDYQIQNLPLDLGLDSLGNDRGEIDWCNMSSSQFFSGWDSNGNPTNDTYTEYQSYYFTSISNGVLIYKLKNTDNLLIDIACHYTNANYLYADNIKGGSITTRMPSHECSGCTQMSLEETTNLAGDIEASANTQNSIFDKVQIVVGWDFTIWLIISWILKIGFVILGVVLIFMAGYYIYRYLNDLARAI
jgi:hypothetical protein